MTSKKKLGTYHKVSNASNRKKKKTSSKTTTVIKSIFDKHASMDEKALDWAIEKVFININADKKDVFAPLRWYINKFGFDKQTQRYLSDHLLDHIPRTHGPQLARFLVTGNIQHIQ